MLKFFKDESGATAIEYGLIAALIAVAIIGAVSALGTNVSNTFDQVSNGLTGVEDSGGSTSGGSTTGG